MAALPKRMNVAVAWRPMRVGEVAYVDAQVARLLETVDALGSTGRTVVAVAGAGDPDQTGAAYLFEPADLA